MSTHYQPTSRDAWKSFLPESADLDRGICAALEAGDKTCQEVEAATGRSHQAVSANLRHLVEKGVVESVPGVFGKTASGRRAMVWRLRYGTGPLPAIARKPASQERYLRKVLLMAAASCQGGHSDVGHKIAGIFDIPFPIRMEGLEVAAHREGFDPIELWPWLYKMRAERAAAAGGE